MQNKFTLKCNGLKVISGREGRESSLCRALFPLPLMNTRTVFKPDELGAKPQT